uniref:Uncharacterized protein n=1 Tax=Globodera rostochiensis TaxID=31243 RepID=A0A914I2B7_GLORO
MGSSSSPNPAHWTPVTPCGCGCHHYRAVQMKWHAHPMSVDVALTPGTVHHAVLIYFVCGICGKENRSAYEITSEGKKSRWGYYGFTRKIRVGTKLNVSYEIVEDIFGEMWTAQYLPNSTCRHCRWGIESIRTFSCVQPAGHSYRFANELH